MNADDNPYEMFDDRDRLAATRAHGLALDCLTAGIEAARPERAVERHCSLGGDVLRIREAEYDLSEYESVRVLGGGKAADDLAAAFEALLGDRIDGGVVVTNEATAAPERVTVREGEHPTPGAGSLSGANAVLDAARDADERTLVIAAIAGGGSALLCAPVAGLSIEDVRAVTDGLLNAGASIDEINVVRRACSEIKGGGLAAAAAPATVVGVLVSDVVGDTLSVIASGPTVPTGTDPAGALDVLDRYDLDAPAIEGYLRTADPRAPADVDVENHVVVSGRDAVEAAEATAAERGYSTCILSTRIEGEARTAGRIHAAIGTEAAEHGDPVEPPAVVLSGGETTVRVTGGGTGGPNQEFALAAAGGLPESAVLGAIDTDGEDGSTDAAGALVDAETIEDPEAARRALSDNDSYGFLEPRGGLLHTGATGTNVNDLRVLVLPGTDGVR
jgi:hydroxypyruvate reductase